MPYNTNNRFQCSKHQYSTNDQLEWKKHMVQEDHTQNGNAPCNYCGKQTRYSYTGKILRPMPPCLCDDCRKKIEDTINQM